MIKILLTKLPYLLVLLAAYLAVVFFLQRKFVFPRKYTQQKDFVAQIDREIYKIKSPEGDVESWLLLSPARETSSKKQRPVVIFAHGNAELIDQWQFGFKRYLDLGIHVLLPEYRGYGRSAGDPSRKKIGEDFVAFYDWLVKRDDVDPTQIILHGRSLGGGVVVDLAKKRPYVGLILQSTYTDIGRLAWELFTPGFLMRDRFENLSFLKKATSPYLVIHGRNDQVIPFSHAEELLSGNKELGRSYFYNGDHGLMGLNPQKYWDSIESYLSEINVIEKP